MKFLATPSSSDAASDAIGRGPLGEPLFPDPFRGSLAHTQGWSCALVTNDPELLSVGVDIEGVERPFRPEVALRIASQSEKDVLSEWHNDPTLPIHWRSGLALFCAKEAVFKTLSPLIQQQLVLSQLSLTYDPAMNQFKNSTTTNFAQPILGYIIRWQNTIIACAFASTTLTFSSSSIIHED